MTETCLVSRLLQICWCRALIFVATVIASNTCSENVVKRPTMNPDIWPPSDVPLVGYLSGYDYLNVTKTGQDNLARYINLRFGLR